MIRSFGNDRRRRLAMFALLAAASGAVSGQAGAQDSYSQAVIQPLPHPAAGRLSEALRQLSNDPNSVNALIDAGRASLALEDPQSALGFFRRAEAVNPADGRVKAGLASVMVRQGQPLEALRLFGEAEQAGEAMLLHAPDRGLAYDLIGDNARAQQEYTASLAFAPDPLVTQRLAVSQAIAGNLAAAEATLLPLLQGSDLSAFRTRAFALAILGKADEAVTISDTMLPQRLSSRLAPYLRYMPRLTRAQQAAAANLGTFPPAAEIGRDDPAVAAYAAQIGVLPSQPVAPATVDSRLVPAGEPLGRNRNSRVPRREEVAARNQPAPQPIAQPAAQAPVPPPAPAQPLASEVPAVAQSVPLDVQQPSLAQMQPQAQQPAAAPVTVPLPSPVAQTQAVPQQQIVEPAAPVPVLVQVLPESSMAQPSSASPEEQPAAPASAPASPAQNLVQAFSDFAVPSPPPRVANGAVDISQIVPRRDPPPAPPAPPKPVVPSRQWVQVATGKDTSALAFDWRRMKRAAGGLLDKNEPYVAAWGQTNRLLTGPFDSASEADKFIKSLKEKNIDSFRFTSARGEEVEELD